MAIKAADKPADIETLMQSLSYGDLVSLGEKAKNLADRKKAEDFKAHLDEIRALNASRGYSDTELSEALAQSAKTEKKGGRSGRKHAFIYWNLENKEQKWSKQGRAPLWMPKDRNEWSKYEIPEDQR